MTYFRRLSLTEDSTVSYL